MGGGVKMNNLIQPLFGDLVLIGGLYMIFSTMSQLTLKTMLKISVGIFLVIIGFQIF